MSLTRKMLAAMEIPADKIEEIISGHMETVTGLQGEIDSVKSETEKYKAEVKKLEDVQKELADLKKSVAAEAKEREGKDYDKLLEEYEKYKADVEKQAVRASKEAVYKDILKDAGIPEKHWAKVLKYSDVDGLELDEKGKAKDAKEILKSLKEEWADHIETSSTQGAPVVNPPANAGGRMTREQIDAIEDTAQRQAAMLENADLYGL